MSASPKSANTSTSSTSPRLNNRIEFEEDFEDDDDIEDPEALNRTLSEIIEGKRSSTSLIAYLNRENSDCDSVQSGSSESSTSGHRLLVKAVLKDGDSSMLERLKGDKTEAVVRFEEVCLNTISEQSSGAVRDSDSAIQQTGEVNHTGDQSGTGDVTGSQIKNISGVVKQSQTGTGSDSRVMAENGAMTENQYQTGTVIDSLKGAVSSAMLGNQSHQEIRTIVNGDVAMETGHIVDSNENISIGVIKHKNVAAKTDKEITKPDISSS